MHETDWATVIHGRAEEALRLFEKESFDLVLTDPPYGVSYTSDMRAESFGTIDNDGAGDRDLVRDIITECVRLVGQNRHLYVFGPTDVLEGQQARGTSG